MQILVVEDNKADVFLIRKAIEQAKVTADVHVVPDGEKALKYFAQVDADPSAACPALVIIDINLPRKTGDEVLLEMRQSDRCAKARVVVVTSSDSVRDREDMARLGTDAYFRKPSDYEAFMKLGGVIKGLLPARS